jgi:cytoskeletal protein CcmA (bactofilin family)
MSYTFSGATADADPGNGNIRLNNASSTAATTIFIDNVDALSSADMTAFISLLSGGNNPSGVLGTVTLRKATFPEVFAQYSVTAVTNASGYQKLTVANKGASGVAPFTSGDSLLVDIALTGDKGDAGDGDVSGPGAATDNAVARFDGTGGSNLNNSGVIIDDSNNITGVNALTVTTNITASNITIVGSASTVGAVAFTSTSATVTGNLTVSGSITASSLTVNGNISASTITVSDITATGSASTIGAVAFTSTGATVTGGLTVTGAVTASNITIVGSASTLGAITVTTTSVGINTSTVTAGTSLEVTGNMRITTTGNGLIFPDGSKQTVAASAGISTGKAIAMAIVFG